MLPIHLGLFVFLLILLVSYFAAAAASYGRSEMRAAIMDIGLQVVIAYIYS